MCGSRGATRVFHRGIFAAAKFDVRVKSFFLIGKYLQRLLQDLGSEDLVRSIWRPRSNLAAAKIFGGGGEKHSSALGKGGVEMNDPPDGYLLDELKALLGQRKRPSDAKFHRLCGIHSGTARYVFDFLRARWPHAWLVPLSERGLVWTLWFLRVYPKEMDIVAFVGSSTMFYHTVWTYIPFMAKELPLV